MPIERLSLFRKGKKSKKFKEEVNKKNKRLAENLGEQLFEVGQRVLIPRTNGDPTLATITSYIKESGKYKVEWINSKGEKCYKFIGRENLKKINDKYKIDGNYYEGKHVLIPRTNGDPTLATIIAVPEKDDVDGVYTVIRKDPDKSVNGKNSYTKRLPKEDLDKLNTSKDTTVVG